jgi:membrane peptidoglycan carboxypeptidase
MADTIDAMTDVVDGGTGAYASRLGRPAAGKTGTTSGNYAAWFDGFTPQLATAVGIYKDKDGTPQPMDEVPGLFGPGTSGELTGGTVPVRIWTDFMEGALKGEKVLEFPERAGVGDEKVPTPTPTRTPSSTTTSTTTTTTTTTTRPTTKTESPKPTKTNRPPKPTLTTVEPSPTDSPTILGGGGGGGGDAGGQTTAP